MATKKTTTDEISILKITQEKVTYAILGKTPFICNSMSNKVREELLLPKGRKSAAERAGSLKHNPIEEFNTSPYKLPEGSPTLIAHLATAFKKAIASTALDIPGSTKAQLSRLLWVDGEKIPLYGIPKLLMSVVRSADINKTPDVRTRAIIPEWACFVTVTYVTPIMKEQIVSNLFAAAGMIQGAGDWRPQKGSGTYGQFEIVNADDKKFKEIVSKGGRKAQIEGMKKAEPYDLETEELLSWFFDESKRRGFKEVA